MSREKWGAGFEKPMGDPTAFDEPATTVLSPYLKVPEGTDRRRKQSEQPHIPIRDRHLSAPWRSSGACPAASSTSA